MDEAQFDTDSDGNVITCPLLGWAIRPAHGMAIVAQLQYATTPREVQTGGQKLQLVLTPQQAQELAEVLTRQAQRILAQPPAGPAS